MPANNTLWPQRAINPIIFSLQSIATNQSGAWPPAECTIMDAPRCLRDLWLLRESLEKPCLFNHLVCRVNNFHLAVKRCRAGVNRSRIAPNWGVVTEIEHANKMVLEWIHPCQNNEMNSKPHAPVSNSITDNRDPETSRRAEASPPHPLPIVALAPRSMRECASVTRVARTIEG